MAACLGQQQGSLPSPCTSNGFSDDAFAEFPEDGLAMPRTTDLEDINNVLDDVIVKINRITDHLRDAGENEAANHFARDMTGTFRALYDIIAPWTVEKCLMKPIGAPILSSTQPDKTGSVLSPVAGNTWASVAASEPVANKDGIIKFRPSDAVKRTIPRARNLEEPHDASDRRVVWVRPWKESRPLSDISSQMRELGPIYSIAFAPDDQAVCIIFQHAHHAAEFMHKCAEYAGRHTTSPFGQEHDVSPGLPYPLDEGLQRMEAPYNERRRLTFARSQLFSGNITEARFRRDIEDVVGASNIETLWLFNTGNATVVFSAVPLAKIVLENFKRHSRTRGHPYSGIQVSYSHDPCERDLHLVTQIPGHPHYPGAGGTGYGNIHGGGRQARSPTFSTDSSYNSGRPSTASSEQPGLMNRRNTGNVKPPPVDEDGWQTVLKRR